MGDLDRLERVGERRPPGLDGRELWVELRRQKREVGTDRLGVRGEGAQPPAHGRLRQLQGPCDVAVPAAPVRLGREPRDDDLGEVAPAHEGVGRKEDVGRKASVADAAAGPQRDLPPAIAQLAGPGEGPRAQLPGAPRARQLAPEQPPLDFLWIDVYD